MEDLKKHPNKESVFFVFRLSFWICVNLGSCSFRHYEDYLEFLNHSLLQQPKECNDHNNTTNPVEVCKEKVYYGCIHNVLIK